LVLCRVRQRTLVLEHLAEITPVDAAVASWTPDELLGLVLRRITETLPNVLPRGITTSASVPASSPILFCLHYSES
jgi:hypothetical protein